MVQSYSPGGANVPSHEGKLAPRGEYDWTVLPSAHQSPQPKRQIIDRFSHFCTDHGRVSSSTVALPGEYSWTYASFGIPESATQTVSRMVRPFLQGSRSWQTDRQTTLLPSIAIGRV